MALEPKFIYGENRQDLHDRVDAHLQRGYCRVPVFQPMKLTNGMWVDILFPTSLIFN